MAEANASSKRGERKCIYLPAGNYLIKEPPGEFVGAGCVTGDGADRTIIHLDRGFAGDLFSWSEAWIVTTPGPRVVGLTIEGQRTAATSQNAFVFYDRVDEVFMDDVSVTNLPGRALYSGATKHVNKAYMRESHLRSLRFFNDGALGAPVVEFTSTGSAPTDATNEVRISQLEIYGSAGPGLVIRNAGGGGVRNITIDGLRIEGREDGSGRGDLLAIGDPTLQGSVNNIVFTNVELIDPYPGFAAIRLSAPTPRAAPYQISFSGSIGGGVPKGSGLVIDAGRTSVFRFSGMYTNGPNIIIGKSVGEMILDGYGQEHKWTFQVDPSYRGGITIPSYRTFDPNQK